MKRGLAALIILLTATAIAAADDPSDFWLSREPVVLPAGKEVQGDYFGFGPRVVISGTVNGDLYAAGGEVLVEGTVNGDLIVAGGTIMLSGRVSQDARIAGGDVTVSGAIGRNATIAGARILLTDAGRVQGNWLAAGGKVELRGPVDGHVRLAGGTATLSDHVGGDLLIAAPSLRLESTASIGRHLRYWSENDPVIEEGATVRGTVSSRPLPEALKSRRLYEGLTALKLATLAASFISTLILGLILVRAYPIFTRAVDWTIRERPAASFGAGALALLGIPLVILVCIGTLLGLPLGLVLGGLYAATLYIVRIFVMCWAGQLLLLLASDSPSLSWSFVTGLILYTLLMLIPGVGIVVTVLTLMVGTGALLLTKKALLSQLREQRLV